MYVQPAVLASFDASQLLGSAYGGHHYGWYKIKHGHKWDDDDAGNGSSHDD